MTWAEIGIRIWRQVCLFLKQFDGAQGRRDLREMRALEAEETARAHDPYEQMGRAEVDALLAE